MPVLALIPHFIAIARTLAADAQAQATFAPDMGAEGRLPFPEGNQNEDDGNDGQPKVAQGGTGLRQ